MAKDTKIPSVGQTVYGSPVWGRVVAADEDKGTYVVQDRGGCRWRIQDGKAKKMLEKGQASP